MDIQSAFASGMQGFQRAANGVAEASSNINRQTLNRDNIERQTAETQAQNVEINQQAAATAQQTTPSVNQSLVQLTEQSRNAESNVRSVQTADQMLGSIIDVRV
ncbi:excinuclease ATPase subunit [Arsukibacterium sp.]|uniref:excinuclease ATPase subunit n=1 Tax=Arsukibacterium sp. TaxID=1977258 RepID=UPI002FDB0D63